RDRAPENPRRARPAGRRARQAARVRRHDRRGDRPRAGGVAADGEAQLGLRPRLAGARAGRLRAQGLTSVTKRAASSTTAFLFFLARFARGFRTTSWSSARGKGGGP